MRRVVRAILWPVRRFFDPRFKGIHDTVQDVKHLLITDLEAANETATLTGRTLDRLAAQNEALLARLDVSDVVTPSEYESFAAAYALRALGNVPPGASVAVIGAPGSVSRAIGALGYVVTDQFSFRTAHHEDKLDAVLCLSLTADADLRKRLWHLTKDGGLLVLGAAVGPAAIDGVRPVYDQAGLDELLEDWEAADVTLIQRREPGAWGRVDGAISDLDAAEETVAMVTATKRPT